MAAQAFEEGLPKEHVVYSPLQAFHIICKAHVDTMSDPNRVNALTGQKGPIVMPRTVYDVVTNVLGEGFEPESRNAAWMDLARYSIIMQLSMVKDDEPYYEGILQSGEYIMKESNVSADLLATEAEALKTIQLIKDLMKEKTEIDTKIQYHREHIRAKLTAAAVKSIETCSRFPDLYPRPKQ